MAIMFLFRLGRGNLRASGVTLLDVDVRQRLVYIGSGILDVDNLSIEGLVLSAVTCFYLDSGKIFVKRASIAASVLSGTNSERTALFAVGSADEHNEFNIKDSRISDVQFSSTRIAFLGGGKLFVSHVVLVRLEAQTIHNNDALFVIDFGLSSQQNEFNAKDFVVTDVHLIGPAIVFMGDGKLTMSRVQITRLKTTAAFIFIVYFEGAAVISSLSLSYSEIDGGVDRLAAGFVYIPKLAGPFSLRNVTFEFLVLRHDFYMLWVDDGSGFTLLLHGFSFRACILLGTHSLVWAGANTEVDWEDVNIEHNVELAPEGGFPFWSLIHVAGDYNLAREVHIRGLSVVNNTRSVIFLNGSVSA